MDAGTKEQLRKRAWGPQRPGPALGALRLHLLANPKISQASRGYWPGRKSEMVESCAGSYLNLRPGPGKGRKVRSVGGWGADSGTKEQGGWPNVRDTEAWPPWNQQALPTTDPGTCSPWLQESPAQALARQEQRTTFPRRPEKLGSPRKRPAGRASLERWCRRVAARGVRVVPPEAARRVEGAAGRAEPRSRAYEHIGGGA
jgi:hypothetical protein